MQKILYIESSFARCIFGITNKTCHRPYKMCHCSMWSKIFFFFMLVSEVLTSWRHWAYEFDRFKVISNGASLGGSQTVTEEKRRHKRLWRQLAPGGKWWWWSSSAMTHLNVSQEPILFLYCWGFMINQHHICSISAAIKGFRVHRRRS